MNKKVVIFLLTAALLLSACSEITTAAAQGDTLHTGAGNGEPSLADPAAAVEGFYAEYLGYIGRERGEFNNPLVDRAYREMAGLHPDFVRNLDTLVEGGLMADPILCAQDIPQYVEASSHTQDGDQAVVQLQDSFPGHTLAALAVLVEGEWLITAIQCGN